MIKTVKCPDCGGEQAVFRNENGNMNCAFCGKEIELPEAVPGEVEGLPAEDEVLSVQPVGDPVECEFILNKDEVETALFATGRIKKRTTVLIIETVVLAIFIIVTAITVFAGYKGIWGMNRPNGTTWFTLALAVLLVPAVWIMPERNKRKMIEASVTGTKVALKVYENLIEVNAEGADSWQMIYDEKYRFIEKDGVMMLVLVSNGQILAVPKRAFKDEDVKTAEKRMMQCADEVVINGERAENGMTPATPAE